MDYLSRLKKQFETKRNGLQQFQCLFESDNFSLREGIQFLTNKSQGNETSIKQIKKEQMTTEFDVAEFLERNSSLDDTFLAVFLSKHSFH